MRMAPIGHSYIECLSHHGAELFERITRIRKCGLAGVG